MTNNDKIEALYRLILQLQSVEDCQALFNDLCTEKELEKMAERIYAAKLLLEGKTNRQSGTRNNHRESMQYLLST